MRNFESGLPTDIVFGRGSEESLPEKLAPYGRRVLLAYGCGSIKRSGIYGRVKRLLSGFEVFELGGIRPNPRIDSVRLGAEMCRRENIDVILAVGGGSVIDCSKVITAAARCEGDLWNLVTGAAQITSALPLGAVPTVAASGSEQDCAAVISNDETHDKLLMSHPALRPKFAVLNPEHTFTVSPYLTACGVTAMMGRVIESCLDPDAAFTSDADAEDLLRDTVKYAPTALRDPENYEARARLMRTASLAAGACKCSVQSCRYMAHELGAYYDITYGAGLAVLIPSWMRYILPDATVDRFCDYAAGVWGFEREKDRFALAARGIDATENFFRRLGLPSSLAEFGIDDANFELMAEKAVRHGRLGDAFVPLGERDAINILNMCR